MVVRDIQQYGYALQLRKSGLSYGEIQKKTGLSKGTLNNWFSSEQWSKQIVQELNTVKRGRDRERLIQLSKRRHREALERHSAYREEARREYASLQTNSLFLVGLALYWGEGDKTENGRVSLINTDVSMLQTTVRFYREILGIARASIRAGLFVYLDIQKQKALDFWSTQLDIPKSQFVKIQVLPSRSALTKRKIRHGICSVYFSNTKMQVKIHEWIRLLAETTRV